MEDAALAIEARIEDRHWWFQGRRRLLAAQLRELCVPHSARVLDVGTGTGANLRLLSALGFGAVFAVDRSAEAIRHCREKGLGPVECADACALPFRDASFDLVLATDILEHLDDDDAAIAGLCRVLRPGGLLLVTVPAFPSLWGLQDRVSHHRRRYRRSQLEGRLRRGGLEPVRSFHFNYLLFGPIWLARQMIRWLRLELDSENQLGTPWLDALLARVFAFDVWSAPRLRPAFGVSILSVVRRPRDGA